MFEQVRTAIEEVDVSVGDGDAIAEGYRLLDRFAAKLSAALAVYDASGQWAVKGGYVDDYLAAALRGDDELGGACCGAYGSAPA